MVFKRRTGKVAENVYESIDDDVLLSVQNLHVWFELRKFGFGHAGYVRAVDGVSFNFKKKRNDCYRR